jgi:serine/threonine-protein kinase
VPSLAGQTLDKYSMLEEVGHGGMAVVYRGRDGVLDREVAVKVLHAHLAGREESRLRLRREALTVAKLRHENIVEIFDYSGPEADESYIVTEFIHGPTLREWLDDRWSPHPVIGALIVRRLCLALDHAHELGVVHRDIKPENVMIRADGCLKLMDFGIAQILDTQKLTMTGQLLGSPAYMAPELIAGRPVDKRTDLFATGILLYQLSVGELPFAGRNPHEVLHKISDGQYTAASKLNAKVDGDLESIIDRALAQEPADRYQSARALANDLEDYLESLGIALDPDPLPSYFRDPEVFVDEFDRTLGATLIEKARTAAKSGHRARALGLLGHALEIDAHNKAAQTLLEDLRRQGRRMRAVFFMVAGVAFGGLVIAGLMLRERADEGLTRAGIPDEDRVEAPSGSGPDIPDRSPVPTTKRPRPDPTSVTSDTSGDSKTPSIRGPMKKIVRVPPPPRGWSCRVQFEGLEHGSALHAKRYRVTGGAGGAQVVSPDGSLVVRGDGDEPLELALTGPRYRASARVTKDACQGGLVSIPAKMKPAQISFQGGNVQPGPDVSVMCVDNCSFGTTDTSRPLHVPSPDGQTAWRVKLRFFKEGYRPLDVERPVTPGRNNPIRLKMEAN